MKVSITRAAQNKTVRGVAAALIWLLVWQILYWIVGEDLILSSPWTVLVRLGQLITTGDFWLTVGRSCLGILTGYAAGVTCGILLGVLTRRHGFVYDLVRVPMHIVQATPVASFIILTLLWIKSRHLSIFISFLMVLPVIWSGVDQGLSQIDQGLAEVAKVYRLSRWQRIRHVDLPAVAPFLKSACRVALGFAWKSGIAAEVIVTPIGFIGKKLYDAKVTLVTADMFAWTAVVILLSFLFEKLFGLLLDRLPGREVRTHGPK